MRDNGATGNARSAERGTAALSVAILGVVLVLAPMILIQAALVGHARQVAAAAARHGVEAARVSDGSPAGGKTAASQYTDQARGLDQPTVQVSRSEDEVTVTVSGDAVTLLPGISVTVSASRTGAVERFQP